MSNYVTLIFAEYFTVCLLNKLLLLGYGVPVILFRINVCNIYLFFFIRERQMSPLQLTLNEKWNPNAKEPSVK